MLTHRVIPCLDTRDGRVVKGIRFAGLRDAGSPAELAARYEAEGADEIVVLDVVATDRGCANARETVRAVRRVLAIPLTVGGGVRSVLDAELLLDAGADKVAINSAACDRPAILGELAEQFGAQCTVLAIDAARAGSGWSVFRRGGREPTGRDVVAWAAAGAASGAGEILLTSIDRDGTRSGYDLELIAAVRAAVSVPMIASGGAQTATDFVAAIGAGADAVLAASIFHDGELSVSEAKRRMAVAGIAVRP